MKRLQAKSKGFTLVELVTVIVILGILGVVALGKFENLSEDAYIAVACGTLVLGQYALILQARRYTVQVNHLFSG